MDFIMQVTNKWKTFSRKINKHFPTDFRMPWVTPYLKKKKSEERNRYSALRWWGYRGMILRNRGKCKWLCQKKFWRKFFWLYQSLNWFFFYVGKVINISWLMYEPWTMAHNSKRKQKTRFLFTTRQCTRFFHYTLRHASMRTDKHFLWSKWSFV